MKNDFRDYNYLAHSLWRKHKYIRKEGNRYIYPDEVVSAANKFKDTTKKVKRDVSYALRNLKSRVSGGSNTTHLKNTSYKTVSGDRRMKDNIANYRLEQLQRATRAAYQDKANRNMYSRQNAMSGDSRYAAPINKKVKRDNSIKISVNSKAAQDLHNQFGKVKNFADSVNAVLKKKKKKKTLKDLFK